MPLPELLYIHTKVSFVCLYSSGSSCMVKRMWNCLNLWYLSKSNVRVKWGLTHQFQSPGYLLLSPISVWACISSILSLAMSLSSCTALSFSLLLITFTCIPVTAEWCVFLPESIWNLLLCNCCIQQRVLETVFVRVKKNLN